MAYKISGTKNDTARIFIVNEDTNTLESQVLVSGTGSYEISNLVAGRKLIVARKLDGESIAYGYVDPAIYIATPTVTTQAVSDTTSDGFTCNGNITNIMDGFNATRRGFCYMIGTSGDPTIANSVAYDDGNFGTGAYTKLISGLSELTNYRVRAYAVNPDGTSYGATVQTATLVYTPGQRGVFGGGSNVMDYITISTAGNASDFGDLTIARAYLAACSSSTRGVFGGGSISGVYSNILDYITISTPGNAIDFGDLTVNRRAMAACSNSTRGVFAGGVNAGFLNVIDYITLSTTGNSTNFGILHTTNSYYISGCSNSTRGIFGGFPAPSNVIDYITIATTGNASDFGDLTVARYGAASCSSSTRGVFGGGYTGSTGINTIDYITIATLGNATDFGDLTVVKYYFAACSSSTRGVFGGGGGAGAANIIGYITIATIGNAAYFGDLTVGRDQLPACSDGHGGLS